MKCWIVKCTFWTLPGPAAVNSGSGSEGVVGAGVGTMTLLDLVANGVFHKELQSHVSGCLDSEGVVVVIYAVVMYRSGGLSFDPKVTLGYPFVRHAFANTSITYISGVFTDAGIGDYTVVFKLSNAVNGLAQRRWVVAMLESLYQSLYKQSNGVLPASSSLGLLNHVQMSVPTSPTVPPVETGKSLSDFEGEYRDLLNQSETGPEERNIGRNGVPSASCVYRASEKLRVTPSFHTDLPSCHVSVMRPYATVSGKNFTTR